MNVGVYCFAVSNETVCGFASQSSQSRVKPLVHNITVTTTKYFGKVTCDVETGAQLAKQIAHGGHL